MLGKLLQWYVWFDYFFSAVDSNVLSADLKLTLLEAFQTCTLSVNYPRLATCVGLNRVAI